MKDLLQQLEELVPLAAAATEGPWYVYSEVEGDETGPTGCTTMLVPQRGAAHDDAGNYNDIGNVSWPGDAEFLAAARNFLTPDNLPKLAAALAAPIEVERGAPQWVPVLEGLPEEGPEPTYVLGRWEDGDIRRCQLYNGVLSCGFPARGGYPVYYMAEPIAPPALRQDGHCVACQYPRYILKGQYWGSCSNEDCAAYKQDMASASYLLPAAPLKGGSHV